MHCLMCWSFSLDNIYFENYQSIKWSQRKKTFNPVMAWGEELGHWEMTFIYKTVCQSEYVNAVCWQQFRLNWHFLCPGIHWLSFEQCCLQTLTTSTRRLASHCGGPVCGTWIRRDANFLLSRHWQPQTARRLNYWPFLRRTLFFKPVGIGREVFWRTLFISVCLGVSHLYWFA